MGIVQHITVAHTHDIMEQIPGSTSYRRALAQKGIPLPTAYTNPKADNVIFGNDYGKERYVTSKQAQDRDAGDVQSEYRRAIVKTNLRESRTRSLERRKSTLNGSIC